MAFSARNFPPEPTFSGPRAPDKAAEAPLIR
jgi:hypothetical protein